MINLTIDGREFQAKEGQTILQVAQDNGIDIPTRTELISNKMSPQKIAQYIGADSVKFLPLESLKKCLNNPNDFCYACFCGDYPTIKKT